MTDQVMREESDEEPVVLKVPCEVYSRIVGYLRPVQNWHAGKQQEFADRKVFNHPGEKQLEEVEETHDPGGTG